MSFEESKSVLYLELKLELLVLFPDGDGEKCCLVFNILFLLVLFAIFILLLIFLFSNFELESEIIIIYCRVILQVKITRKTRLTNG